MERYKSSLYIVRGRCAIPLGTIVKVRGCGTAKGWAEVEWDNQLVALRRV